MRKIVGRFSDKSLRRSGREIDVAVSYLSQEFLCSRSKGSEMLVDLIVESILGLTGSQADEPG